MLRIIQSTSAATATAYFTEGLKREDYYSQGQECVGRFYGKAAAALGLNSGKQVLPEDFEALANNQHPLTKAKLTPRTKAGGERIPGWDFNFHAPKSLSVLQGLTGDDALVKVFRQSVAETMGEIEKMAATRVRVDGRQEDRLTSNIIWAEFVHFTARPAGKGKHPDPHLHIHAYIFNATFDGVEARWKALKIHDIKVQAPYFEALFHSILAKGVADLGYSIKRTRDRWEIYGVDEKRLLDKNSSRALQITAQATKHGITDAREKAALGAKTRGGKRKGLTQEKLQAEWNSRLTDEERAAVSRTHERKAGPQKSFAVTAAESIDFAESKLFERDSVVRRNRFLTAVLKHGVGYVTLDDALKEMAKRGYIERNVGGDDLVTTVPRVVEEAELIQRVRDSRGKLAPMVPGRLRYSREFLSKEQREAVRHLLKSNDQVMGLRGIAGAGKTTLLQEVRDQIHAEGKMRLFAFAPSADASRDNLRKEGFEGAETVAHFLANKKLQERCRGQVILIDEAGTIGIRDLLKILEIAGDSTRIILAGDTGQHAPVSRADALRLLEIYSGMPVAVIRQILRQEKEGYRKAVEAFAAANLKDGFARLEEINAILEIPDAVTRYQRLAADYVQCQADTGKAPLVISPTHAEAREVTAAIRARLTESGKLGAEKSFLQYRHLQWEGAEKSRPENYEAGLVVQYHQNARGVGRGSILTVLEVDSANAVWLRGADGKRIALDLKDTEKFRVYEAKEISLAAGDLLKITNGAKSANGRRLNNGTMLTVEKFGKDGSIRFSNGVILDKNFGHVSHGYCHTSHSAQGKTVREVFIAQSASSFLAGSREQFYVSASRGKENLRIYTDDRTALQKAVGNSSRRLSALEFTGLGEELFVKGGLNGTEWTKRIVADSSRRQENLKGHVEKLMAERRMNPQAEKIQSFTAYIDMKRANVTSDGKSRSKGHPSPPDQKKGKKGMTTLKRVEMRDSTQEKVAKPKAEIEAKAEKKPEAKKPQPAKSPKIERMTKAVKTMNSHLGEVVNRTKDTAKSLAKNQDSGINFGNVKTTLGRLNGPKAQKAQIESKANQKPSQTQKPKPPAPVMRRGR